MAYQLVPVRTEFRLKDLQQLAGQLDQLQGDGWELVFVFPVTTRTCIFLRNETNLMVLRKH